MDVDKGAVVVNVGSFVFKSILLKYEGFNLKGGKSKKNDMLFFEMESSQIYFSFKNKFFSKGMFVLDIRWFNGDDKKIADEMIQFIGQTLNIIYGCSKDNKRPVEMTLQSESADSKIVFWVRKKK